MKLLLIDPDQAYSRWLAERLADKGFVPQTIGSLEQALREKLFVHVRGVIAGIGPSGPDGASVTRLLRRAGVDQPLMILSPTDDWSDTIECLDAGADDYLVKPVRSEVVAARLRAIIRRGTGNATDRIVLDGLELDLKAKCAWQSGKCLNLTRNEFRLLSLFMLEPNRVMTHRDIHLQLCTEGTEISRNAIEVQIARLRRKVGRNRIQTIRGAGYSFRFDGTSHRVPAVHLEPCRAVNGYPCPDRRDVNSCSLAICGGAPANHIRTTVPA